MRAVKIDPARLAALGGAPGRETITYTQAGGDALGDERRRLTLDLLRVRTGTYRGADALAVQAAELRRLTHRIAEIDRQAVAMAGVRAIEADRQAADIELRRRCAAFLKGQAA